jgi:hypothetical protein
MLVLAAIACGQTRPPDKGAIEGKVVNLRGEPLRKTTLWLRPLRPELHELTASTDNEGRFVFEGLEPANWLLSAGHAGYLNQSYGTRTPGLLGAALEIRAASRMSDLVITMTPQGIIAGKVTDEDGDPVTGVQVNINRVYWFNNTRYIEIAGSASLNPDGTFMVGNLMPGRYYACAFGANGRGGWVPTCFPDTTDFSSASRIEVSPGADIRGINLRLHRGAGFQIRGTVTGAPKEKTQLRLISLGSGVPSLVPYDPVLRPNGEFIFPNVAPGSYVIVANVIENQLVSYVPVTVNDRDLAGIAVALGPGLEINGTVRMEDGSAPQNRFRST